VRHLRAGVNINTIRAEFGHVSLQIAKPGTPTPAMNEIFADDVGR